MCEAKSQQSFEFVVINGGNQLADLFGADGQTRLAVSCESSLRELSPMIGRDGDAAKMIDKVGVGHIHDSKRIEEECRPGNFGCSC